MNNAKLKELLQGKIKQVEKDVVVSGTELKVLVNRLSAGQIAELTTIRQKSIKIKSVDQKTQDVDFDIDFENAAMVDLEYKATAVAKGIADLFDTADDAADLDTEDLEALYEVVSDVNGLADEVANEVKDFRKE